MTQEIIIRIEIIGIILSLWLVVLWIRSVVSRLGDIYGLLQALYDCANQDRLKALAEQNTETPEERRKRKQREASKRYKDTHDRVMGLDGKYHYIKK